MNVIEYLDRIANNLESQGLLKEAEELDIISNTIEAMDKDAVKAEQTQLAKLLQQMISIPDEDTIQRNFNAIDKINQYAMFERFEDPNIENSNKAYERAKELFRTNPADLKKVTYYLDYALKFLKEADDTIQEATDYRSKAVQQQSNRAQTPVPPSDFAFTSKNIGKAPTNKPPVINPALRRRGL